MRTSSLIQMVSIFIALLSFETIVVAQPATSPLNVQGLDQFVIHSVRSRAMGGTSTASGIDASALFSNPAGLSQVSNIDIRVSGSFNSMNRQQEQNWVPLKSLPGLSLLFDGLSQSITVPPDTGSVPISGWNKFQKQYDNIKPNWETKSSDILPLTIATAMPLMVAEIPIVAGLGFSRVMNLDHYYQNNNSMTPYLGNERPYQQWSNPTDTIHIKWYQYLRSRRGSVWGITPGIAVKILPELTVGGSVTFMFGASDDLEQRIDRGHLSIAINQGEPKNFLLDTVYYSQFNVGTSTYNATGFSFGLLYQQPRYNLGFSIKPVMTLTRNWDGEVRSVDTTRGVMPIRVDSLTTRSYHRSGTDLCKYPVAISFGAMVKPTDTWTVAFDYDLKNLGNAEYQTVDSVFSPWVNTKADWRIGAEYYASSMVALRAGYANEVLAFAPDGSAIVNDPASVEVYSLGVGVLFGNMTVDLAYEFMNLEYHDLYQSNVNYNSIKSHQALFEVAYKF